MTINWLYIVTYVYWAVLLLVTLQIIFQYTISSRASAWLFTVYVFPVFGIFLYFIFGFKHRNRKIYKRKMFTDQDLIQDLDIDQGQDFYKSLAQDLKQFKSLAKLVFNESRSGLTVKNQLTLLENGESKYPQLFSDIKNAKESIHLEYYIFKSDETGKQLIELLISKARQNVTVRFIYDHYGSSGLSSSLLQRMRSHGIQVQVFAEIELFAFTERLNYRNHRKIVVVDDNIAYVGGINIGNEYNNEIPSNKSFWRDSHLRIEGHAVAYLQNIFVNDWNFCTGEFLELNDSMPTINATFKADSHKCVQIVTSGPDSPQPTILFSILQAIYLAEREILITTPYFLPNPALIKALKTAVLRGVKVRLLVPDKSDTKIVNAAAQSFYYELLLVGAEVYKYQNGFVHAKTMVVDQQLSVMGTANFDERSFELNFEVNALIYDSDFSGKLANSFATDIEHSCQLSIENWKKRSLFVVFVEKLARLISPIL